MATDTTDTALAPTRPLIVAVEVWRRASSSLSCRGLFFFAMCVLIGAVGLMGAIPVRRYGHDTFFLLDNGWRAYCGQRVHLDYTSAFGPVMPLLVALGLKIANTSVNGLGYMVAIAGAAVAAWSWWLGRSRLETGVRMVSTLSLAALVVAPYPLGGFVGAPSYAMLYNRLGYALLGLVILEAFAPQRGRFAGGVSSGIAVVLAFFLKVTFGLVGVVLLAFSLLLGEGRRARGIGVFAGIALAATPLLAYLQWNVTAMLADFAMSAAAKSGTFTPTELAANSLSALDELIAAMALAAIWSMFRRQSGTRRAWEPLAVAGLICAADILLISSNTQEHRLPLLVLFALFGMNQVMDPGGKPSNGDVSRWLGHAGMLALAGVLIVPQLAPDLLGLGFGLYHKIHSRTAGTVRFSERRLAPLLLYQYAADPSSNGPTYTTYVNEGVKLLRSASAPSETVLAIDMENPFPYAMGRRPAAGGIANLFNDTSVSAKHHPPDEKYFGDADIVMVPKRPALPAEVFEASYGIYAQGLQRLYRLAAESDWWYLYRRK